VRKLDLKSSLFVALFLLAGFELACSAQTFTTLVNFNVSNGSHPLSTLTQGTDGALYGTTLDGGSNGAGNVFRLTPDGTLTTVYTFCLVGRGCSAGADPWAGVVQASDGNFYGTTTIGGANSFGAIFKLSSNGQLTVLHSFCYGGSCTEGHEVKAAMIRASDGNLYGTTEQGGSSLCTGGCGTVFKITPGGSFSTVYTFCTQTGCPDGSNPIGGLVQGTDGNFYGTTSTGGTGVSCNGNCGTIFKLTPGGTLTTLYEFCPQIGCSDGYGPWAGLVQATDGNFYGTTYFGGGSRASGTAFKITPAGAFTVIHTFCTTQNCPDGQEPDAALIQAIDGNFYGTTHNSESQYGGVFQMTPQGVVTSLHNFVYTDGSQPQSGVIQATNGNFYGVTYSGGSQGFGTLFEIGVPLNVPPAQFTPITPCRLIDTRSNGGPIQSGTYRVFDLLQLAQSAGCSDISTASSYSLNVTLIPYNGQRVGYLTIWPSGRTQPLVSTMNSLDGRTKANAAMVPAGAAGAISVFVANTANVVLDIDGYFTTPSPSTLKFFPLAPCRVADTRSDQYPQGLGSPHLNGGTPRDFPILNSTCIPSGISPAAYSFNLTAIPYPSQGHRLGYLEVWPTGQEPENPVSTLNNPTGTNVANAAIVPAGSNGEITVYPSNDTDLAIDINGYFASSGNNGLSLYPTLPCRVIDTRNVGSGQPFSGTLSPPVNVGASPCGIPSSAQGYVFNATVIPSPTLNYLTLWPDGEGQPQVSTLNAGDGWVTSNMAILPNQNGKIDAYAQGSTQLILDISSYFAP
jgi:uncharacterized repeat protein (TIGR03803 family)